APKSVRVITDRYRAAWEAKGNDPKQIPFIGMARHVVIADTDAEALKLARRAYARWWASFIYLWDIKGAKPPFTTYAGDFDAVLKAGQIIAGTADTVRDMIATQAAEAGLNYFLTRFAFGDLTLEESMRSIELFNSKVQPALEPE
ncbi:MAG: LLM class flavin-dependent oxidoreductase, partial [Burkholderiales bacterium]